PTVKWGKGKKRPWNASLKVLCWHAGESFVKCHNREHDVYGKLYVERKARELARNAEGKSGRVRFEGQTDYEAFKLPGDDPSALAAAAAVGGCVDPLRGIDYMIDQVPEDRLRRIESLDLAAVSAPTTQPATRPADTPAAKEIRLSLAQCRAMALEGNLALRVALLSPTLAAQSITEAEAQFESLLYVDASRASTDTPTASVLSSAKADARSLAAGVRMPLRTGGSIDARLPVNSFETNNAFSTLNPSYTADLTLSVVQPLLRGAGVRTNTHAIRVSRWNRQKSEALAKLEVIRVLAAVDRVYWRLYAAREQLAVRRQEHRLAQAQLERARRQVAAGAAAKIEILRSELGVAEGAEAIIVSANVVRRRERELKRIIQKRGLGVASPTAILPDTPPLVVPYKLDADKLVEMAMANRMELLDIELKIAMDASSIDFERSGTLPLVTLSYTYNVNGLGATHADAFDMLFDKRFEDHRLGVHVEVPLGNQAARSRLRRAILTRIQDLASLDRRKVLVAQEVHD
ncbi:hypothetical protein LCGC14_2444610, partial [marine sediment metagenome]